MKKQHGGSRPNAGKKRGKGLPETGEIARLPTVLVAKETLEFLRSLPNLSEFVRAAIQEKINSQ